MKTFIFRLCWALVLVNAMLSHSAAQNVKVDSTDILYSQIKKSRADTFLVKKLMHLANYIIDKPRTGKMQLDSGVHLMTQAAALAKKLRRGDLEGKCFWSIGDNLYLKSDTIGAYKYYQRALDAYHNFGDFINEGKFGKLYGDIRYLVSKDEFGGLAAYKRTRNLFIAHKMPAAAAHSSMMINVIYQNTGRTDLAIDGFSKLEILFKRLKKLSELQDCQNRLGDLYWKKGDIQQSLFYGIESLKTAKIQKDPAQLASSSSKLASIYYYLKLYKEALPLFENALKIALNSKGSLAYQTAILNVVHTRVMLKNSDGLLDFVRKAESKLPASDDFQRMSVFQAYAMAYEADGNIIEAERYFSKMSALLRVQLKEKKFGSQDGYFIKSFFGPVGKFYIRIKRFEKARPYLTQILSLPKAFLNPNVESEANLAMFQIDSAAGNFRAAVEHFRLYKQFNDSLFNSSAERQVSELNAKYRNEQREQDIRMLKTESAAEKAFAQKITLQRNMTVGGLAALLMIAGLSYYGYRIKKRTTKHLELQQLRINQQYISLENLVGEKDVLLAEKESLLIEKDWLLKEVHHRVKNNLQIIMSLLNSQLYSVKDGVAKNLIQESQHRIHSISLIHQKLYQQNDLSGIGMHDYIRDHTIYLQDSFDTYGRFEFKLNLSPVYLDVSQAVPLALILNESITNAIKHASTPQINCISIALRENDSNVQLTVSDNGPGLPNGFDLQESKSLGMKLIKGLTLQLKGILELGNGHGLTISVSIKAAPIQANTDHTLSP